MSMEVAIKIDAKEFLDFMGAVPRKLQNALNRGIETAAFIIERESKIRTPVDTGRLRASIYTMVGFLNARVSTNVNYARYVHQGTRFMKARPFMFQAVKDSEYNIKKTIEREINEALT